jgi:ankyrin repeat protein
MLFAQLMTNLRFTLQEACVDYLLQHEAAVDFCDDLGHSALDVARMLNRGELLKKLEEHQRKLSDESHTGI